MSTFSNGLPGLPKVDGDLYQGSSNTSSRPPSQLSIKKVTAIKGSHITKLLEPLMESNWMAWHECMKRVLRLCGIEEYVEGKIIRPNNAESTDNWWYNDNYAQVVIMNNITSTEIIHVGQCSTSQAMWDSLEAVHESKGHQTIVSIIWNLFHMKVDEDSDINGHLNQLKQYWERINQMNEDNFKISDVLFKIIISLSLLLSWDTFMEPYVGGWKGVIETDPKKLMGLQFISILKEEYLQRQLCTNGVETINQMYNPKGSLQNRLTLKPKTNSDMNCK